jgi:ABC-type transporter MlaC component
VGKPWSSATPEQQKQLYEQFTLLLVRTYAASLAQLRNQDVTFKFLPVSVPGGAKDIVVQSHVISNGGDDAIDYRLTQGPSGWKIYDINMMGAWLIQVYQTQFADQIAKGGIDGLIKFLTEHNQRSAG